jgi:hypothetical protein
LEQGSTGAVGAFVGDGVTTGVFVGEEVMLFVGADVKLSVGEGVTTGALVGEAVTIGAFVGEGVTTGVFVGEAVTIGAFVGEGVTTGAFVGEAVTIGADEGLFVGAAVAGRHPVPRQMSTLALDPSMELIVTSRVSPLTSAVYSPEADSFATSSDSAYPLPSAPAVTIKT